jgi:hypothetical protein
MAFKSNPAGWRRVFRGQGAQAAVDSASEQMAARARAIAPIRTGYYRDHIVVREVDGETAAAQVVAEADYGAFVEARDNVLGRAIQ